MTVQDVPQAWMARALQLAERGLYTTDPNPRVGCVIVRDGEMVGEGWHARAGEPHAEVHALERAGERARGATVFVTLEPCCHQGRTPPCTDALIAAGVAVVVTGAADPNPAVDGEGAARLRAAGIDVVEGVLADACERLNRGYVRRMRTGLPWVTSKIAMSLDGRTALADGASQWITGRAARTDVQQLRARSSAILTGIGTVLADDPSLNVRDDSLGDVLQPVRVVIDSRLRLPPDARLLGLSGETRLFTAVGAPAERAALEARGALVESAPGADGQVDLAVMLSRLAELEYNEILVEAGPVLNGALLRGGLIDELVVYIAPHLLGDAARGMFRLPEIESMNQRLELEFESLRRVGRDYRLTARPVVTG